MTNQPEENEIDIEKDGGHFKKLGISIEYGITDEDPNYVILAIERSDGKGVVMRQFPPEHAAEIAKDIIIKTKKDPRTIGLSIEREDGEEEMVAIPPDGAIKLAEHMMKVALKAKILNDQKGLRLKEEYIDADFFEYRDRRKGRRNEEL